MRQVSSWKPAGVTWVRVELRAAALETNTAANKSDELSWDQAKNIAYDIEELIDTIGHEAVYENLNDAVMNSTNSEVSSEEPEFVWTVLCPTMTQKSVRKADTNRTDQDSADQQCFSCVTVGMGDRVINVECT